MNKKLNACIVGLGRAGQFHLASLKQLESVQLKCVVDPNLSATDDLILSNSLSISRLEEVLADPTIDALIVSAPTGFHFDHITRALSAGKHVFAEKPLGKTLDEINQCFELAEKKGLALHLGFQRRFDHNFIALKKSMEQIGPARIIKTSSRDNPKPSLDYLKISGNIYHDMLIHDFDMLCFLLGPMIPESVYSIGHAYDSEIRDISDFDTVMVNLQYSNGLLCSIDTSRTSVYGYDQRIEVFAEKGMAIAENEKDSTVQLYTEKGIQYDKVQHSFPQRYRQSYQREMEQFAIGIQNAQLYTVSRKECVLSHLIAEAAHESAINHQSINFKQRYGHLIPSD